jgi:tetratricopeptide (TPR) repeat protein
VLLLPMLGLTEHPHYTCDRYGYLQGLVWAELLAAALWKVSSRPSLFATAVACSTGLVVCWGGLTVRQIGFWHDSIALFEHMIAELGDHPYRSDIQWRLGSVLGSQGKTEEAVQQFQASLRIKPTPEAHLLFGELLEKNGNREGALTNCMAALALAPTPLDYVRAGRLLATFGRGAEAIKQYRTALALTPDLTQALNNLAWALATDRDATNRNGAEAVQLAEKACNLTARGTPVMVGTLAAAYAEAGRFKEAIATAQEARALAQAAGQPEVAQKNRQLLKLYQSGRPYHEPPPEVKTTDGHR